MTQFRITLVRHGETTGESSIRYHGINDVPLSPAGEEQMRNVELDLRGTRFARVFTSRLIRSRRGAEIIAPNGPVPTVVTGFNEVNFGHWEGLTREEIAARDPELYEVWRQDPHNFRYPSGDDRSQFAQRVVSSLQEVLAAHPTGNWLMVLHRGVIAAILNHTLGEATSKELNLALGSMHIISRKTDEWSAERLDHVPGI